MSGKLSAQMMTDTAGYLAQRQSQSISDDYQASQKASRGGKALSPWESELINDAQFTANIPLPSVTFDVNDDFLAQRIGEEVSHFYHPTPPPRNPSGFWQRIEQRYESVFEGYESVLEQRAFIAEGRAAANSEVIRESLGNATANQQNDLNLGYTESVAQAQAAEWGVSEIPLALAPKFIQTGIKISRLMDEDKWWFLRENQNEKIARMHEVQFRLTRMEKENIGYNVSPESWFKEYSKIGEKYTYITDYEAIAKVLGPVQSNTKIGVNFFLPKQGNISAFKELKLEYQLGLKYWSLSKGFRFSKVSNLSDLSPRIPPSEAGNTFFKGPYQGLPGGGPELVIDSMPTRPWPWN